SIALSAMLALWTLGAPPVEAAALRVDQLEFNVTADPGETVALSLQVQNIGEEAGTVRVYTADWRRLPEGDHLYLEPGTLAQSAAQWIHVAPSEFQLDPEARNTVRFTVTVPGGTSFTGTHWGMLFVESSGRPEPGMAANVTV